METARSIRKAMLDAISRGENRSSLFWWMVENHDHIAGADRSRIHWKTVVARATALGLTDTTRKPYTEDNARQTWRRARASVAKARAMSTQVAAVGVISRPPSRMSPDWRPQEVIPPPPIRPVVGPVIPAHAGAAPVADEDGVVMTPEGQAEIDRVKALFTEMDRKKFRFGG